MKFIAALIFVLVLGCAVGLAVVYSGAYNVSTDNHDNALVNWVMETTVERSVKKHAQEIAAPSYLSDTATVALGFREYRGCVGCHGAPGIKPGPISKGLFPEAPDLAKTADEWTAAEVFWIIKYGVKFTSMPAWGPSHDDRELWAMTAFVKKLPKMSAEEYQAMMDKAGMQRPGGMRPETR